MPVPGRDASFFIVLKHVSDIKACDIDHFGALRPTATKDGRKREHV